MRRALLICGAAGGHSLAHVPVARRIGHLRESSLPRLPCSGFILGSPARVSRKREFSWFRSETFENSRPKEYDCQSLETLGDEKSPHLAGLSYQQKKILRKQEWVAELEGLELGHSRLRN